MMSHCAALRELETVDVAVADSATIGRLLGFVAQLEGFLASFKAAATLALRAGGGPRPEVVLGGVLGKTAAGRASRHADVLQQAPAVAVALNAGAITPDHVDAMTAALKHNPRLADLQIEITQAAIDMAPDQYRDHLKRLAFLHAHDGGVGTFEQQRHNTRLRMWTDLEGTYHLRGRFDPERGAQLLTVLSAEIERQHHAGTASGGEPVEHDQRMAVALLHLVTRAGTNGVMGVTMNVHVDERTLRRGIHADTHLDLDGGGVIPADTLRRIGCDALFRPILLNEHGVAINIGRTQRLATPAQRAALRAMHPTCGIPGCHVPFRNCQIHHIHWWRNGGHTNLNNMIPVCTRHHHDIHEGGWTLTIDPQRRVTFQRPPPANRAA